MTITLHGYSALLTLAGTVLVWIPAYRISRGNVIAGVMHESGEQHQGGMAALAHILEEAVLRPRAVWDKANHRMLCFGLVLIVIGAAIDFIQAVLSS